jgi:DNA-binding NarL/FixJ family response regulator
MGLTCVLVDDNHAFLDETRILLEQEGVTVVGSASSTDEALQQARALCPDVVLIDIALGDENGFDLVRRLADDSSCGQISTIMISTHSAVDYADLIYESPAAGFLPKEELTATAIRRLLGRS